MSKLRSSWHSLDAPSRSTRRKLLKKIGPSGWTRTSNTPVSSRPLAFTTVCCGHIGSRLVVADQRACHVDPGTRHESVGLLQRVRMREKYAAGIRRLLDGQDPNDEAQS